jgi:pimeloyl-ACP methyl ester carboxylesterase
MDSSSYKDLTTSRGFIYHYYFSAPQNPKPTLLFLHGFPSTSYDWRHQVAFFQKQGYGLIVPDMLGYGGTAKPTDPVHYKPSLVCADLINILDAEDVNQVIVIGHDWGSLPASRLANYHPQSVRFIAFAFLSTGYIPPAVGFDMQEALASTKKLMGYELYGYWLFFSEPGADKVIESHFDSFTSVLYPSDPKSWITHLAPVGALKAWLLADQTSPLPPYITEEEAKIAKDALLTGGLGGPVCSYKIFTQGLAPEDDKSIPLPAYHLTKPVFFGAATKDCVTVPATGKFALEKYCKEAPVTIREFDTGHWVALEAPDELNKELATWIGGLGILSRSSL